MVVSTAEFKKGLKIRFDGEPYSIVDFQHVKPGKGGAFVRTKLKHMRLGRVIDNTFRAGEKVELVDFEDKRMQYLYHDDRFHFMDLDTYDQISLSVEEVGEARDFLKENIEVEILFINDSPITVELPNFIELQIAKTDPGIRGDTASGDNEVHEHVVLEGATGRLRHDMLHLAYPDIHTWVEKHNRYSNWEAAVEAYGVRSPESGMRSEGAGGRRESTPHSESSADDWRRALRVWSRRLPCRPTLRFCYSYFLRGGFLDGYAGDVFCRLLAKYEMLSVPPVPLTVNCVIKLNPDAVLSPPLSAACQVPPAAV